MATDKLLELFIEFQEILKELVIQEISVIPDEEIKRIKEKLEVKKNVTR